MAAPMEDVLFPSVTEKSCKIVGLKVKSKSKISKGTLIATYKVLDQESGVDAGSVTEKFKANVFGTVEEILVKVGDVVSAGDLILKFTACMHPTVMKDMCAECGADLRETAGFPGQRMKSASASVAMVHSIPELQVSKEEALRLANQDEIRLLKNKKLTLVVDLDQTVIHTTMDNVAPNLPGVKHFQLWGSGPHMPWYHTKIRPGCQKFLEKISKYYELHIFTMGARLYAHTIAGFLDPDKRFFSHRILSRDECFDQNSKTANLKSIFPCGDSMVCIIDDRDDVWNFAPNLIQVRPYRYFEGTGDINSPPGLPPNLLSSKAEGSPKEDKPSDEGTDAAEAKQRTDQKDKEKDSEKDKKEESTVDSSKADASKVKTNDESDGPKEADVVKDELEEGEIGKEPSDEKDVSSKKEEQKKKDGESDKKEQRTEDVKNKPSGGKDFPGVKDDDGDDYFLYLEDILIRIHAAFFKAHGKTSDKATELTADLKEIVPKFRNSVLSGTYIVFSGVFPTNMPPEQSRAWKAAVALGAQVSAKVIPREKNDGGPANATTHLIAAKAGTNKVHTAQRCKKIHIVTAEWLWCCWERWDRVDERMFILPGIKSASQGSSRCSTPPNSDSDTSTKRALHKKRKGTPEGKSKQKTKKARIQADSGIDEATGSSSSGPKQRPSLSSEYNPLYCFSTEDLESMDKEVEDIFQESSSSGESDTDARSNQESLGSITQMISSSSEESLTAENPRGWSEKRKRRDTDSDKERGNNSGDSTSSPGVSEDSRSSGDEDMMAEAIDDLLTYSKVPSVSERLNLQAQQSKDKV